MRRVLVLLIVLIFGVQLLPINTALESSDLENGRIVANLPSSSILFTDASPGKWIYVSNQGDVILYEWNMNEGALSAVWSEKLKKPGENSTLVDLGTINSASYSSYEIESINSSSGLTEISLVERLAVGYSESGGGAINIYLIEDDGLDSSIAGCVCTRKIPTTSAVSALEWDIDGKLWYGLSNNKYAQKVSPETGINDPEQTSPHANSITKILVFVDSVGTKWVVTGGDDGAFVHDSGGIKVHTLGCDCTTSPTDVILTDSDSHSIFIMETGQSQIKKYDTTSNDWASTEQSSSISLQQIKGASINSEGNLIIGTSGKLVFYGASNFTKYDELPTSNPNHEIITSTNGGMMILAGSSKNKIWLYDVDKDEDGVGDMSDAFPNDPTEYSDFDGDGVGDNADVFPSNPSESIDSDSDGVGDNADEFETTDTDGDGVGNNGDAFPDDINEWSDTDLDGFGDNVDSCLQDPGTSTEDRIGCPDIDGDGYSDPSETYPSHPYGSADAFPYEPSQWRDQDDDGYGDNMSGVKGDQCPMMFGTSNFTLQQEQNSTVWTKISWYGCADGDGDEYTDTIDQFPDDPNEWIDADNDGFGSESDYDDYDLAVQTKEDYCRKMESENITVAVCIDELDEEEDKEEAASLQLMLGNTDLTTLATIMVGLFVGLTGGILGLGYVIKLIRPAKKKGVKAPKGSSSAFAEGTDEVTAEDGGDEFAYSGELTGQEYWEDDPLEEQIVNPSMVPDEPEMPAPSVEEASSSEDDEFMSESAGSPPKAPPAGSPPKAPPAGSPPKAPPNDVPVTEEAATPPLPPGGLPEGWTEDQWKWYGHEWLEKNK